MDERVPDHLGVELYIFDELSPGEVAEEGGEEEECVEEVH